MTHTHGPWRVTEWPGVSGDTHFGIDAQKWRLAIVHSGNADDATLMAAAPELLAALLFIVNDCPAPGEAAGLTPTGYNMACAAIAKAEGRE